MNPTRHSYSPAVHFRNLFHQTKPDSVALDLRGDRAEFKILGQSELRKLNRIVSRNTSHAVRGVLFAKAGLLDEAEREFQTHLNLRPADERVKGLLRTVQSWRPKNLVLPPSKSPQQ